MHLYDIDLEREGVVTYQGGSLVRGEEIAPPVFSPCGYLGLSIGLDLRFPELYRELVLKGAQTLLVPSQVHPTAGANHW